MKKFLFTLASLILCSTLGFAQLDLKPSGSDRLDARRSDGTFKSFMVDDIFELRYVGENAENGEFTDVEITFHSDEKVLLPMSEFTTIDYNVPTTEWMEITRTGDEHARVIMLDCLNNDGIMDPNKPADWVANMAGLLTHFIFDVELGYDETCTVTGLYTGKVYTENPYFVFWTKAEENMLYQDAWCFIMPNEPVAIEVTSKERTTYVGCDFLGVYNGYQIALGAEGERLVKSAAPSFQMELKYNEVYTIASTDENAYGFADLYTYDEDKNSFIFQDGEGKLSYQSKTKYGVDGKFYPEDFALIDIRNLTIDKPENKRKYIASKSDFSYICAAGDEYGTDYLIETTVEGGDTKWYYVGPAKSGEAELQFIGDVQTIGEPSEAFVSYDGEVILKYVLEAGKDPVFVDKGLEAGTYTSTVAGQPDLILNGFNTATIDGTDHNYTIESSVVYVTVDGETLMYIIDKTEKTYTLIVNAEWDGGEIYKSETLKGVYHNFEETSKNKVTLRIDQTLLGDSKPGYASLKVELYDATWMSYTSVVGAVEKYIYDAEHKTLTLTNVLLGSAEGVSGRRNITFRVADDMRSIYLEGNEEEARIYAYSPANTYVVVTQDNPIVLEGELPEPIELADEYTGAGDIDYMGSVFPADKSTISLTFAQNGNATITVNIMGEDMLAATVAYTLEGNALTLKGVTVGDGNYGTKEMDLTFTVNADGTIQCTNTEKVSGSNPLGMSAMMTLDLATLVFTPVGGGETPAVELAASYTGKANALWNGSNAPGDLTLNIDQDESKTSKPGYATFGFRAFGTDIIKSCVEYTLEGNVLTLKGVLVGMGDYMAGEYEIVPLDITFTVNTDGGLQCTSTGTIYGAASGTETFALDLTTFLLTPVPVE